MSQLLDEVRNTLRVHHYAVKTEKAYVQWVKRFILFHKKDIRWKWVRQRLSSF